MASKQQTSTQSGKHTATILDKDSLTALQQAVDAAIQPLMAVVSAESAIKHAFGGISKVAAAHKLPLVRIAVPTVKAAAIVHALREFALSRLTTLTTQVVEQQEAVLFLYPAFKPLDECPLLEAAKPYTQILLYDALQSTILNGTYSLLKQVLKPFTDGMGAKTDAVEHELAKVFADAASSAAKGMKQHVQLHTFAAEKDSASNVITAAGDAESKVIKAEGEAASGVIEAIGNAASKVIDAVGRAVHGTEGGSGGGPRGGGGGGGGGAGHHSADVMGGWKDEVPRLMDPGEEIA